MTESIMTTATAKPKSITAYVAAVPATHRGALKKLRGHFKKLYPEATEHISYGKPLFKLDGHPLAGFYAAKHHSSLFVWSDTALGTLGDMLDGYDTAEGTVRFDPDKPPPVHIVKAILDARAKEIKRRWGGSSAKAKRTSSRKAA
jgi:uncharacterized protein YdhG (YjbR/CyaY superfamily)